MCVAHCAIHTQQSQAVGCVMRTLSLACFLLSALAAPAAAEPCSDPSVSYVDQPLRLAYRDHGPADARAVLLVGGTDQQLTDWPAELIASLKARGFRPIVFDARDVGCSASMEAAGPPDWAAFFSELAAGRKPAVAYDLPALAGDVSSLTQALALESVDIIAVSGGATVAAQFAADHPEKVRSMVILAPGSGISTLPIPARPERFATIPPMPPADAPREQVEAYRVAAAAALEGSQYRRSPELIRAQAATASARGWNPDGTARTGAALLASGDLRPLYARVNAPLVVLHGADDPLLSPKHGEAVATAAPDGEFHEISGLGHALPAELSDEIADYLLAAAERAQLR
jgi:pimeloyl-ACP methyl ester carboxylesterase